VTLLAIDFPPFEFIIFAVAILLGVIGKIVEFARKVRQRSIEAEQRAEQQFGAEPGEAGEPPRAPAPPPRLELFRRLRPRAEQPPAHPPPPPPPPRVTVPAPPQPREHEIVRLLRAPRGVRTAIVLAEVLGRPRSLRRGR
jgi:hypothetical protein